METGYNFAGVKVRNSLEATMLIHFLFTEIPTTSEKRKKEHEKIKEKIRTSIINQLNEASKNPIEACLLYAANSNQYNLEEKATLMDKLYLDLKAYNRRNKN